MRGQGRGLCGHGCARRWKMICIGNATTGCSTGGAHLRQRPLARRPPRMPAPAQRLPALSQRLGAAPAGGMLPQRHWTNACRVPRSASSCLAHHLRGDCDAGSALVRPSGAGARRSPQGPWRERRQGGPCDSDVRRLPRYVSLSLSGLRNAPQAAPARDARGEAAH